jgi:hypothetical protein
MHRRTEQPQVVLRENADIGWLVRPNNPKLLEVLNQAIDQVGKSAAQFPSRMVVYLRKLKQLRSATSSGTCSNFNGYGRSSSSVENNAASMTFCCRHRVIRSHDCGNKRATVPAQWC